MTTATSTTDVIDQLAGPQPLRDLRPQAKANAQASFEALLETETSFTFTERYAVAAYVAGLTGVAVAAEFYSDLLSDTADEQLVAAVTDAAAAGRTTGPYGTYRESGLQEENTSGPLVRTDAAALGERLAAAFDWAHLLVFHPRDSRPEVLYPLANAGWTADEVVTLGQLVSFLSFQLRIIHGLRVLAGAESSPASAPGSNRAPVSLSTDYPAPTGDGFAVTSYPNLVAPTHFVSHPLGWQPWLEPVAKDALTEEQVDSLIRPDRVHSPYFRLLARDPRALRARTLTDLDIFYNTDSSEAMTGLGRAERELGAAVTSRRNGCVYCASVHAGRTMEESTGREADVDRLLEQGVDADLGSPEWNAVRDAAVALTDLPLEFSGSHVEALRAAGLDDAAVIDTINSSAFFNWANRLMLGLGEPELPKRFR